MPAGKSAGRQLSSLHPRSGAVNDRNTSMTITERIANAVLTGDDEHIPLLVEQALTDSLPAREILQDGLLRGMQQVSRRFRDTVP